MVIFGRKLLDKVGEVSWEIDEEEEEEEDVEDDDDDEVDVEDSSDELIMDIRES